MKINKIISVCSMVILLLIVTSCGDDTPTQKGAFKPGKCIVTEFNADGSDSGDGFYIDYSGIANGYVGAKVDADEDKYVFQVDAGGHIYNYWFDSDHKTLMVPLQNGSGSYTFKVLKNTSGDKYAEVYVQSKSISLKNNFKPFIRSNCMVDYSENSECVKEATKLAAEANDDLEFVQKVYEYIENKLDYDQEFADSNPAMYYPNLDSTLDSGKGICFDYAALAAGMIRSQGIPAKLITGYVSMNGDVYHAWNMIYIKKKGWIVAKVSASAKKWNRIDITMDDTGDISSLSNEDYTQKDVY